MLCSQRRVTSRECGLWPLISSRTPKLRKPLPMPCTKPKKAFPQGPFWGRSLCHPQGACGEDQEWAAGQEGLTKQTSEGEGLVCRPARTLFEVKIGNDQME